MSMPTGVATTELDKARRLVDLTELVLQLHETALEERTNDAIDAALNGGVEGASDYGMLYNPTDAEEFKTIAYTLTYFAAVVALKKMMTTVCDEKHVGKTDGVSLVAGIGHEQIDILIDNLEETLTIMLSNGYPQIPVDDDLVFH